MKISVQLFVKLGFSRHGKAILQCPKSCFLSLTNTISRFHIFHVQTKNPTAPSSPSCTMHVVDPTFLGGPRSHLFPVTTCPLLLPVIVTHHYLSQAVLIATCTPPCIHMHVHTYIAIDRHDIIPKSSDPSILDLLHD